MVQIERTSSPFLFGALAAGLLQCVAVGAVNLESAAGALQGQVVVPLPGALVLGKDPFAGESNRHPPALSGSPPAPAAHGDQPYALPRVLVTRIRISGNRAIPTALLRPIVAPYEGRRIDFVDLQRLRAELSRFYLAQGYINSGAVIPDQQVVDGVLEMRVIEGRLTAIELFGNRILNDHFLRSRIARGSGPPLNIQELGQRLQLLQRYPSIVALRSELIPGVVPGEAKLKVQVVERPRHHVTLDFSNAPSPGVGPWSIGAGYFNDSLTGNGDRLALDFGGAMGLAGGSLRYEVPLNRYDTRLTLRHGLDESRVVEPPFEELAVRATARSSKVALNHPLIDQLHRRVVLGLALEHRHTRTTLLGQLHSFGEVDRGGHQRLTQVVFDLDGVWQWGREVLALRSSLSVGLDLAGATVGGGEPDGEFVAWLGQAQWVGPSGEAGGEWLLRSELQLASDPLPITERYAAGGIHNVRGYRSSQQLQDNTLFLSAEYRGSFPGEALPALRWALFCDFAEVWGAASAEARRQLASVGVGLLWSPSEQVEGRLYWGHPLEPFREPMRPSLQDRGLHFQLQIQPF